MLPVLSTPGRMKLLGAWIGIDQVGRWIMLTEGFMRKVGVWAVIMILLVAMVPASVASQAAEQEFVVLYADGVSLAKARSAIAAAGGTIVKENRAVGLATVKTSNPNFVAAIQRQPTLYGAGRSRPIGYAPRLVQLQPKNNGFVEDETPAGAQASPQVSQLNAAEPLAGLQWDMAMIDATAEGSHSVQPGSPQVLVGVIDTGVDASHPDIAPNFNHALSRNFTTDIPLVDGPCEEEPDQSCEDPSDVDEQGHGSHVAGTVAAAINGIGMAGVAPNVSLVNLRAGQDSGYFFLQSTVDALTYAGDNGIDAVNMSFYTDPWLFNCVSNPADSPAEQMEQRTVIKATQRALRYATRRGVTLVNSAGNSHLDLGNPLPDASSPDFPPGTAHPRTIDNATCLSLPAEGDGVIAVSALGPSGAKADYSNYGVEQIDVSAPGGYFRDFFGTPEFARTTNQVLSVYPEALARASGGLNPDGSPNTPAIVRDCQGNVCAYYRYIQGTSMAAPHVTGVAALIVSEFGAHDAEHGGLTLSPAVVRDILTSTATEHACPDPPLVDYTLVGRPAEFNALCVGDAEFNGFYGHGIVNALNAVSH
jgi:subtilisin family serine protease